MVGGRTRTHGWAAGVTTACLAGVAEGIGATCGVLWDAERSDIVGFCYAAGFYYQVVSPFCSEKTWVRKS